MIWIPGPVLEQLFSVANARDREILVSTNNNIVPTNDASARAAQQRLSARDQEILKDIIHTYVLGGEPVSSRTLSKHAQHGVSAATIRNVMADLEDIGLLRQPHSSAGRVPTEAAYRLYVETLMRTRNISARERRYIDEQLESAGDGDHMVSAAGQLLSELSQRAGIIMTPVVDEIALKSADFVPLGGGKLLCVLVSMSGFVDNVVIETKDELDRQDLVRISNYMTENFAGTRLREIRDHLLRTMAEDRRHVDHWLSVAMQLAGRALERSVEQEVLVEGAASMIGQPELMDVKQVRRMLDTFADKARLVEMLSLCLESDGGVRVFIGEDSGVTSELGFSLVATAYGNAEGTLGSLGVIGPSRMEYPRMVPLVRYLGQTLSRRLAESSD